jgi:hypothetical protein
MAKKDSQPERNAAPSPGLETSFGQPVIQPRGFATGTVDVIGCMAGDWDVRMKRNISNSSTGESASEDKSAKSKGGY